MKFIEKSLSHMEKKYENKKNKHRLILLLNRYYLIFLASENLEYIDKAFNTCLEYLNKNKSDFDILLAILFFSIQLKDKEKIEYFNNIVTKHKKYLKNNDEKRYLFYLFLKGLIKNYKVSPRGINKYIKILNSSSEDISNIYVIFLKLVSDIEERNILECLEGTKNNIFWKNIVIYYALEKKYKFLYIDNKTFNSYIKWAIYKNILLENSLIRYEKSIKIDTDDNYFNQKLYSSYSYDFILKQICEAYLIHDKHDVNSYYFYKEGINRQLSLSGLISSYIKVCYENEMEEIGVYPIRQFLKERQPNLEITSFVYHIILKNKKYNSVVLENRAKILKYGIYCMERKYTGRYYYSIYRYMLDFVQINSVEEKRIMDILYINNYLYEIEVEDKSVKYIAVKSYEINKIKYYTLKDGRALINIVSPKFYCYTFTEDKKELLNSKIKINKVVENLDFSFFLRFFNRGFNDNFTLINVCNYYIENDKVDTNRLHILEKTLGIEDISLDLKIKILQSVGNIHLQNNMPQKAILYYKKVPEKDINDKFVNNVLIAYVKCNEYEKAINLINGKENIIDENVLFYCMREISNEEKYYKSIVKNVYNLILKNKIDTNFIDIIIKYYKGGLNKWIDLRHVLNNNKIVSKEVDEYILKLTMYTHNINELSEEIFLNLYQNDVDNPTVEEFFYYCIYEGLNSDYVFSKNLIYIMEYLFKETNDSIVGYFLAHMYLKDSFDLEEKYSIFENIVNIMEEENINFKIFEKNIDKFKDFSYLYKNKPFIYNAPPDKDIYLYYREQNQDKFKYKKMKYFKFGMYIITIPVFYGESIEYYFTEEVDKSTISTKKAVITNTNKIIFDKDDEYFKINNSFIYSYDGQYEQAHKSIQDIILQDYNLKGEIL